MADIPKEAYKFFYMVYLLPYFIFSLLYLLILNYNSFSKKSKDELRLDMKMILIKTLTIRNEICIGFWLFIFIIIFLR